MTLEEMVGRQLVFGVRGPDVTDADLRLFEETRAGGLILYRRNFEGPERLACMLTQLESALGRRLLVTTDHEGGRIIMLGAGVTIFPDNLAVGTAGEVAFAKRQGLIEGRELRRLGVDVSFGPVSSAHGARQPQYGIRLRQGRAASGASAPPHRGGAGVPAGRLRQAPGKGQAPVDAHSACPSRLDWGDMNDMHIVTSWREAAAWTHHDSPPLSEYRPEPRTRPRSRASSSTATSMPGRLPRRRRLRRHRDGAITDLPIGEATVRAAAVGHDLSFLPHEAPARGT